MAWPTQVAAGKTAIVQGTLDRKHPGARALLEIASTSRWTFIASAPIRHQAFRLKFVAPQSGKPLKVRVEIVEGASSLGHSSPALLSVRSSDESSGDATRKAPDGLGMQVTLLVLGAVVALLLGAFFTEPLQQLAATLLGGLGPSHSTSLRGYWRSTYAYASAGQPREGEQIMRVRQVGTWVSGKSLASSNDHRHRIQGRLRDRILTATWDNLAEGASHKGAFQLKLMPDGQTMEGRWVGFDRDGQIQDGKWEWTRLIGSDVDAEKVRTNDKRIGSPRG